MEEENKYFTQGQRIVREGKHESKRHRGDFWWLIEDDVLKIYIEESDGKWDWKDNFKFKVKKCDITGAKYHGGFYDDSEAILENMEPLLNEDNFQCIEIIAYSKGAASSGRVSDVLRTLGYKVRVKPRRTFGCPNDVKKNKKIKELRRYDVHYVQGLDIVFYGIFWLKKYGKTVKIKGRGNPFKSHDYYHLEKK